MERTIKAAVVIALAAVLLLFVGRLLVNVAGTNPIVTGLSTNAERGGCPGTPTCVSSYATTRTHAIEPIACDANTAVAQAVFADAINTLPDVETTGPTSWIVYSDLMRFPDDVRIEISSRGIEVLSGSRVGSGDLGVNRNRMEAMRMIIADDERCNQL